MPKTVVFTDMTEMIGRTVRNMIVEYVNGGEYYRIYFTDETSIVVRRDSLFNSECNRMEEY